MSAYETPKPTYAPEGARRCERCNALVMKGRHCHCSTRYQPRGTGPVKVRYVNPCKVAAKPEDRGTPEERKAMECAIKRALAKPKPKAKPKEAQKLVCRECGEEFERPYQMGRVPTRCPGCRGLG